MTAVRRPEVFISATSADLRSCRQVIKEALLTLGCVPIEQTNFPPDYRTVREMLRAKIAACDAVIHLAGVVYGAEPQTRDANEPRRSYTQLEYDLARELKKPLYVFVCGEDFSYDPHDPEPDDKRALQQAHRAALSSSETLRYKVGSRDDLALRVRELQTHVEALGAELKKTRSWLGRGVAIGLAAVLILGAGLWWLKQRADVQEQKSAATNTRVAQLETELDKQRRYIRSVADAFTQSQAQLRELKLTDEQLFDRALAAVAAQEKIPKAELRGSIELFVAAIKADRKADFMDRALADFAEKNFASAAVNAGEAGKMAREQYLAAEKLAADFTGKAEQARARAREAFSLQGQALDADGKYPDAIEAFEAALAVCRPADEPASWTGLQILLGTAWLNWSAVSEGAPIADRTARAIAAFRAAVAVGEREKLPRTGVVLARSILGLALVEQAERSNGEEAKRLLAEAVEAHQAAIDFFSRDQAPEYWARSQDNLASALRAQSQLTDGHESAALLAHAIAAHRAALQIFSRDQFPEEWASSQDNLAISLRELAERSSGPAVPRLIAESAASYRAALQVRTKEAFPDEWAETQQNLATTLRAQAHYSSHPVAIQLLGESVTALQAALEVRTRERSPHDWAMTQTNLAAALAELAEKSADPDAVRRLAEAAVACRSALEIYTREHLPGYWAIAQSHLALILRDQAKRSSSEDARQLLTESVAALQAVLEVHTRQRFPQNWAMAQSNLVGALHDLAKRSSDAEAAQLLAAATDAARAAIEVYTREQFPQDWAKAQANLGIVLRDRAVHSSDETAAGHLSAAIAAHRAALRVFTRDQFPQAWAAAQVNLTAALRLAAERAGGKERAQLLRDAITAQLGAMEVFGTGAPAEWQKEQRDWMARAEAEIAALEGER